MHVDGAQGRFEIIVPSSQVLSLIYRMDGCQFAGATQLLTASSVSKDEAYEAAGSMAAALDGALPDTGSSQVPKPEGTFQWRQFRGPTKQLLCGLANSLQQALPEGWTLKSAVPSTPLRPRGPDAERCHLRPLEMEAEGLTEENGYRYFVFNSETSESSRDWYESEDFYHLVFSADEGTEAGILLLAWVCRPFDLSCPGLPGLATLGLARDLGCILARFDAQGGSKGLRCSPRHCWRNRVHQEDDETLPLHARSFQNLQVWTVGFRCQNTAS